jgi:phosphate transport system permease protein
VTNPPVAERGARRLAVRLARLRGLGQAFRAGTTLVALAVLAIIVAFVALLVLDSLPAIQRYGFSFFTSPQFSTVPVIVGTLVTSALALVFAVPIALGVAIFSAEVAPKWMRTPIAYVVDLGATIPSVVYGFWALEVLVPWMSGTAEPHLSQVTGGGWPFSGLPLGQDILTASLVLAIMIVPTISALSREALYSVPRAQREAALSLGATRWDATRIAVLGPATPGIMAAVMLGLGRAIGETIAVALVIGSVYKIPTSLFSQGGTIPSLLVNQFSGAIGIQQNVLIELGLVLLVLSFSVNLGARLLIRRVEERTGQGGFFGRRRRSRAWSPSPTLAAGALPLARPAWWERAVGRRPAVLRRRKLVHALVVVVLVAAVLAAVLPLASLIATAAQQGGSAVVTPSFYTSEPPPFCLQVNASTSCPLGGIGPAIQGTLILLGLASLIAVPAGLFTGIYLSEYGRNRFGRTLSLLVDVMVGVPSILLGVFVFAIYLQFDRLDAESALAGASALALLMIPIVTRATEIALRTVSREVREAALALGFPRHRVTLRIVLGNAKSALLTGNLLALGRAGGETAALVLTAGTSSYWFAGVHRPIAALGPLIYYNLTSVGSPNWTEDAWGAALVLLLIMAAVSLAARYTLRTEANVGSV